MKKKSHPLYRKYINIVDKEVETRPSIIISDAGIGAFVEVNKYVLCDEELKENEITIADLLAMIDQGLAN